MPFLLLDDATDEATRRLTQFGQNLLQPPQPPAQTQQTDSLQDITGRLQDFGSQQLQSLQQLNQPPFPTTAGQPPPIPGVTLPQPPPELVQLNQPPLGGAAPGAAPGAPAAVQTLQPLQPGGGLQDITQRLQDHGSQVLQAAQQQLQQLPQVQPIASISGPPAPGEPQAGGDLQNYARQVANKYGIDPDIFVRQIQQESGFNPGARSPAGATGIAQFMPDTARGMGIDPTDPYAALDAAARLDASNLSKYGGDYSKALAAYNAGGGNVDKYGGVPPFQETQNYVSTILGGAKQAVQGAVQGVQQAGQQVLGQISQFGDKQLSAAEAYAACGPAAAVRFAQMFGRQPTLREAVDLASSVGWTAAQGMAGLGSESALFDKMGIPHRQVGADWQALAREAQSGNPVTISTPGHYFTADSYDPSSGAFHVGSSGTDLRGGGEWMTPAQMEARMGQLQGGLAGENPQVPGDSPLSVGAMASNPLMPSNLVSRGMQILGQIVQPETRQAIGQALQNAPTPTDRDVAAVTGLPELPGLAGIARFGTQALGGFLQQPSAMDAVETIDRINRKMLDDPASITAQDRADMDQARLIVGGLTAGEQPRPAGAASAAAEVPKLSVGELADALRQYPEEIKQGLRDFVRTQTEAGTSGADINDILRRWVADNPLEAPPTPPAGPSVVPDLDAAVSRAGGAAATGPETAQPASRYDPATGEWTGEPPPPGETAPSPPSPEAPAPPTWPKGVTQDMVDAMHQRIDRALDIAAPSNYIAHDRLDQLLNAGANPGEIERFLSGVTGQNVGKLEMLRALRTGAMAGGLSTEAKVAASPFIQTALRAPAGAVNLILQGRAGDIPAGLAGGMGGLVEGARDALQTMRYGTNYRALGGGPAGGYGFTPGLDVLGSNPLTRTLGTGLIGLVRTHGAISDISAGIGRGANLALGASPAQAAEAGQQWALRSGQYGTIGSAVNDAMSALRGKNPGLDVASQILLPFYRVGYNVFTQGVERSPLGLGGRVIDAVQGRPLDRAKLVNNLFGVGLAGLAFTQAAAGNITGEQPEGGAPKQSVRIPEQANLGPFEGMAKRDAQGNLWLPLRALGAASEPLAQAAALYESARDNEGNLPGLASQFASEYVKHVADETWLSSLQDAMNLVGAVGGVSSANAQARGQAQRELAYQAGQYGKSFIPQEKLGEQIAGALGFTAPSTSGGTATATRPRTSSGATSRSVGSATAGAHRAR